VPLTQPCEELGEHGLAQLAIDDRDDSMGAEGGDSDSASPDVSMLTAGPVTHETTEMLASTDVSPARLTGPRQSVVRSLASPSSTGRYQCGKWCRFEARGKPTVRDAVARMQWPLGV
jgi:hypothetical protein